MKLTDLGTTELLEAEGITDVYCCGLVLDICVKSTALHAAEMGFRTCIVEDACKPLMAEGVATTKAELAKAGVDVVSSTEAAEAVKAERGSASLADLLAKVRASKAAVAVHKNTEKSGWERAHSP